MTVTVVSTAGRPRRRFTRALVALGMAVGAMLGGVAPALAATGTDIANIAGQQIGKGCSGNGWNCHPDAWCADFAGWVWAQAGVDTNGLTAGAGSFVKYGEARGLITKSPQVGDAVVYDYNGNGWARHVNLVTAVRSDGLVQTIGGNQGNSPGIVSRDNWHSLAGTIVVRPAGVTNGSQVGPFYQNVRRGDGNWDGWSALDGFDGAKDFKGSDLSVVTVGNGATAHLTGIGNDGNLYHRYRTATVSQPWAAIPGYDGGVKFNASKVSMAGMPDQSVQFLAIGNDKRVYHNIRFADGNWQGWGAVQGYDGAPGFVANTLAATGMPDGSAQFVATGNDGYTYHNIRFKDGNWQGWSPLRGTTGPKYMSSALSMAGMPDGSLQIIGTDQFGDLNHIVRAADGNWTNWAPLNGAYGAPKFNASKVATSAMADGSTQVLATGNDGNIYHNIRYADGNWQGWGPLQGAYGAAKFGSTGVAIAAGPNNSAVILAIGH
ncbi:CHAP domain-containing protein [Pseudonocardiaceae bacterium YIM PH 21723]|nr:CHAP domain-containing protein [Pseudonocardiaceae bacterium YIM PH 21723]